MNNNKGRAMSKRTVWIVVLVTLAGLIWMAQGLRKPEHRCALSERVDPMQGCPRE